MNGRLQFSLRSMLAAVAIFCVATWEVTQIAKDDPLKPPVAVQYGIGLILLIGLSGSGALCGFGLGKPIGGALWGAAFAVAAVAVLMLV
ncbi:MAG TPA: hypothetical protein VKB78_04740 [Pirellulales bacterium]|nr:hypothetical protein [Pirellulales bacterium]